MNWFKHDTTATNDSKLKKLILRHGAVGYAVYFHCLELIAGDVSESNITFELEHDSEIIADNLKIKGDGTKSGQDIVEDIMRTIIELKLFEEYQGHIFCFKLMKRLDASMTSNQKIRNVIAKAKENNYQISFPEASTSENNTNFYKPDAVMINHDKSCKKRGEEIREDKNRLEEREIREDESNNALPPQNEVYKNNNFSRANLINTECFDEIRNCYEQVHSIWVKEKLPLSTASQNYFTFSCRELKVALGYWAGKGFTSDEILGALKNFIEVANLIRAKESWMDSVGSFDFFAKHILDFVDGNFDINKYKKNKAIATGQKEVVDINKILAEMGEL